MCIGAGSFKPHPNAPPARSAAIFSGGSPGTSVSTRSVSAPNAGARPVQSEGSAAQGVEGDLVQAWRAHANGAVGPLQIRMAGLCRRNPDHGSAGGTVVAEDLAATAAVMAPAG